MRDRADAFPSPAAHSALEDHVLLAIGSHRLSSITTSDLQTLVDRWQSDGHRAATIRNWIKPLQAIYRRARSREGLALNPTHDLELPAAVASEVEIVAPDVAARLLGAVPDEDRAITVTFDLYGHLMPGTEAEGAALLDAYLNEQEEGGQSNSS